MIPPAQAAERFGAACLLGALLGIFYGFLRPLRTKGAKLADSLFVLALLYTWLQLSFGICRGDIRPGYSAGLFLGVWLFDRTAGRLLRPVFRFFWQGVFLCFRGILFPVKKFFQKMRKILKFFFASWKKWGTIKWNKRCHVQPGSGGAADESQEVSFIRKDRIPQDYRTDEDRHCDCCRIVYRRDSDPAHRH